MIRHMYPSADSLASSNTKTSDINFFEDSGSFMNKRAYYMIQPRYSLTTLDGDTLTSCSDKGRKALSRNLTKLLVSDMGLLIYSNSLRVPAKGTPTYDSDGNELRTAISITGDYLSYYTTSLDIFVINLNSSNSFKLSRTHYYTSLTTKAAYSQRINL